MKKKDIFFVSLFVVCFLVCGIGIAGESLYNYLESRLNRSYVITYAEEKDDDSAVPETSEKDNTDDSIDIQQDISPKEDDSTDRPDGYQPDEILSETSDQVPANEDTQDPTSAVPETDTAPVHNPDNSTQAPSAGEIAGNEYFDDALFIGDSRTVGLMEYGNLENATFFAESGLSVFDLEKKPLSVPGEGKLSFDEVLEKRQYGKIYLMLGLNELGYPFESVQKKYRETVEKICQNQPKAVIYLCANMHVTADQSKKDKIYNNDNVNWVNDMISGLADNEHTFFIDVNELFDDAKGNLSAEYSSDAFHIYGKHYMKWADWLRTKTLPQSEEG